MIAYSVSKDLGSEGGAGWSWVNALNSLSNITVVTRKKNVDDLLRQQDGMKIIGYDLPGFVSKLKGTLIPRSVYYQLWMLALPRYLRTTVNLRCYDYAWHLTFASVNRGSAAFRLGIPVVWGPVGGATKFRLRLLSALGWKGAIREMSRSLFEYVGRLFSRLRAENARAVIYQNPETILNRKSYNYLVRTNIVMPSGREICKRSEEQSLEDGPGNPRILFVSRIGSKGERLLERFVSEFRPNATFTIVGSVQRERWLSRGLGSTVHFVDWLPRTSYLSLLDQHDGFVSLSTRESAGWAIAEALNAGIPAYAFDINGPAGIAQQGCGTIKGLTLSKPGATWQVDLLTWIDRLSSNDGPVEVELGPNFSEKALRDWLREVALPLLNPSGDVA